MAELNRTGDSVEDLARKYDEKSDSPDVEDELAALKASMGK